MRQAVILAGHLAPSDIAGPCDGAAFAARLAFLTENIARYGIDDIIVLVRDDDAHNAAAFHGRSVRGAAMRVLHAPALAGSAGALRHIKSALQPLFLVTGTQSFFDINYLALTELLSQPWEGAIALRQVADGSQQMRVKVSGDRVIGLDVRALDSDVPAIVSGGVFILRRDVLDRIAHDTASIETDVLTPLIADNTLAACQFDAPCYDFDMSDYWRAMRRPALLLDRDNTLTKDSGYTYAISQLEWLSGAKEAIRLANDSGWLVLVVTNQSGIGRGYFTEAQMHAFHAEMQAQLRIEGAHIDAFYVCPFHEAATIPEFRIADHPDRKPNPGMLLRAAQDWRIDVARSVMLGDNDSDVIAGARAGMRAILVKQGDLLHRVREILQH